VNERKRASGRGTATAGFFVGIFTWPIFLIHHAGSISIVYLN
jgi:hypothetical protein